MMGRIEEALQKLQARSSSGAAHSVGTTTAPLAAMVPRERTYGGPKLLVDRAQLRANGLLALDSEERQLQEQYRTIKRPLLRNADPGRDPPVPYGNLVMVASALSGEGKTFSCLNLCLSIAREPDWNVVLVDGDCSKPHLSQLFGVDKEAGLMDLLRDPKLNFDSLVMSTDIPGLSLLPAGTRDSQATELLASKRMDQICDYLSADRAGRMIVFDSSPLLMTTEARVLGSKVGQVVLVVRADQTPRRAVLAALEKLDPAKAIGCVLNQMAAGVDIGEGYGPYGYGEPAAED